MTLTREPAVLTGTHITPGPTARTLGHPLLRQCPHLYCSPPWLLVEDQAHPGPAFHTWVQGEDFAAYAPSYGFDAASNPWPFARPDLFLADGAGGEDPGPLLPAFTIGGRRPGHSTFHTDGPARERPQALARLLGAAAEHAAERGASCLAALYCSPEDADLQAAFLAHGGVRFPSHGTNVLGLPGDGFEDWMASLPRKQRAKEKADLRKLREAGVDFEVSPLREADLEWIVPLELGLYGKHGHAYAVEEAAGLHRAYLDHLGDDALVVRARRDGTYVGFTSLVRRGSRAYVRQAGFDPEGCADAPVYFGAALHEPIRWACAHGVRSLDLSITADATKQRRGARTRPREAWFVPLDDAARQHLHDLRERRDRSPLAPPTPKDPT
ncbi:GNAT family N-acetyltransferase [Streptomyces sp. NPDC008125]|uniref:GNAT family N-acetyltransferase n=1 Tax=Streptomyces sp. NPDC008125 TaxID=3364811 RepID=UPI0036E1718D